MKNVLMGSQNMIFFLGNQFCAKLHKLMEKNIFLQLIITGKINLKLVTQYLSLHI